MAYRARAIDTVSVFNKAEQLLEQYRDAEAFALYSDLRDANHLAPLAYYRMGEIHNRQQRAEEALACHRMAFQLDTHLARGVNDTDHPCYDYTYSFVDQTHISDCPMCGEEGRKHSCYNAISNPQFTQGFDPIRLWMYCDSCHHVFASNYPTDLGNVLRSTSHGSHLKPNPEVFPSLGVVLRALSLLSPGKRLLEIGVGAGEMAAVAKEFLFDVTGLDIRPTYAEAASKMLDIPIHAVDFLEFQSDQPFDVICMGDVLEHTSEPHRMLENAVSMLSPGGVLWISTPNFESAFSRVMKDDDPLWKACEHLNYFCYRTLRSMLQSINMNVIDYTVSRISSGTMEVTSIKQ